MLGVLLAFVLVLIVVPGAPRGVAQSFPRDLVPRSTVGLAGERGPGLGARGQPGASSPCSHVPQPPPPTPASGVSGGTTSPPSSASTSSACCASTAPSSSPHGERACAPLSVPACPSPWLCTLVHTCAHLDVLVHACLCWCMLLGTCLLLHACARVSSHVHTSPCLCKVACACAVSGSLAYICTCLSWPVQTAACLGTLVRVRFCTLGHHLYVVGMGTLCSLLHPPALAGALHVPMPPCTSPRPFCSHCAPPGTTSMPSTWGRTSGCCTLSG